MIIARGLSRRFGDRVVVDDVSFELAEGTLCVLLGPNGAGKTTTLRMLLGLIGPTSGTATVAGIDLPNAPARLAELRGRVGLLTEAPGFYDRLSALDNLVLFGRLYGLDDALLDARIERDLNRLGLWERRHDLVATFSKGMKQRLALIRTIFHDPPVLFFDEPTSGLDPEASRDVRRLITSLKQAGRTIIVSTHNLAEAAELADVVGVIQGGLRAFGAPSALGRTGRVGRVRFLVEGNAELAAELIRARVMSIAPGADGTLDVELADPIRDVAPLVAVLVGGGIGIREVRRIEPSLEDVYLRAIGSRQ